MTCLLTTAEMYAADKAAAAAGIPGPILMENAGWQVARADAHRASRRARSPSCAGPATMAATGSSPRATCKAMGLAGATRRSLGEVDQLKGDAALMAQRWPAAVEPLSPRSSWRASPW